MPHYQKTKRRRKQLFRHRKQYPMRSSDAQKRPQQGFEGGFRVMTGGRPKRQLKWLIIGAVSFILVLTLVIGSLLSPTGLLELFRNLDGTLLPVASWPVNVAGTELYRTAERSRYFYALSDTDLSCFSKQGRTLFSVNHGFSKPLMSVSETRCLVYDQNGTGVKVFNADRLLTDMTMEYAVYAACIGRDGTFAVATKSANYTSMITVYSKDQKVRYQWFCPEDLITGVALAPDGDSLAVSSVRTEDGRYVSTVQILQYNAAEAVTSYTYDGEIIYGLQNAIHYGFCVIGTHRVDTIFWKNGTRTQQQTDYEVSFVRTDRKSVLSCFVRQGDSAGANVTLVDKKQKVLASFEVNEKVDDIRVCGKHILVLSGNEVLLFDRQGQIVRRGNVGFGTLNVVPINRDSCLAVGHTSFQKVSLS